MAGDFTNRWRVELEGDQNVKSKLDALLTLQQRGLNATQEEIQAAREAGTAINTVTRAQNTLIRAWQASHPQLALLSRGLSGLASIGRTLFNIFQGLNLMMIRQREDARNLRDAQQEVSDKQKIFNDLLRQFGADNPATVKAAQDLQAAMNNLLGVQDQIDANKWQDLATQITAIMSALAVPFIALKTINELRLLISGISAASSFSILSALGTAVGAMARAAPVAGPIITAITLLIERLSSGKPITLESIFGEGSFWAPFIKDAQVFIKFWADLPKHAQIAGIRFRRWVEDMWEKIVNVFTGGNKKAIDSIKKWVDDVVKYFQDLYKKVVGGSIVPDMMDEINEVVFGGLATAEDKFQNFGLNVESIMKNMGERVGNILINDFQRATDAISRIDDIARTRSLTNAERQQLQESQVSQHVLGGAAGVGVNTTRQAVQQSLAGAGYFASQKVFGRVIRTGEEVTNILRQYPELNAAYSAALAEYRQQGNTIIINQTVQGSLLTEREVVSKISSAIAQAV